MTSPFAARRAAFRALHAQGCFALPNPWDAGGAKRLEKLGFKALASTSAGAAWSMGKDDGQITRDEAIAHLRMLCAATELPVNADFENGFAETAEGVGENVALVIEAGVAGVSIEDWSGSALYDLSTALERLKAARAAIDASGEDVMLVGRTEGYLRGVRELAPTLERLKAYAEAGVAPHFAGIDFICRAITPVNSARRYNTRFFLADGGLAGGSVRGNGELEDLAWRPVSALATLNIVDVTEYVLREALRRWQARVESRGPALGEPPKLLNYRKDIMTLSRHRARG